MHQTTGTIPVKLEGPGTVLRALGGWGGMAVAYAELPAGTDLGPLLEGLPGDVCPCPHWGYLVKGKIRISHSSGDPEVLEAGEVFYLPSGHGAVVDEDAVFVEFSPDAAYQEVLEHVLAKAGA